MNCILILGNQLFDPAVFQQMKIDREGVVFFIREDRELASYYKFHKHKIILFFAAMRSYREELKSMGYSVHYEEFDPSNQQTYQERLEKFLKSNKISKLFAFEIEDKFFEKRIEELVIRTGISFILWQSPMFLTSRSEFESYLKKHKKPFMKTFYEAQRRRLNILMDRGKPIGGVWSLDSENRLALPKSKFPPQLPRPVRSIWVKQVISIVDQYFPNHPGQGDEFWLPVDREGARKWLQDFVSQRLEEFGPFEDAIPAHSDFVYHSVLSPFLNMGLLTPNEVIDEVIGTAKKTAIPLASVEGFVRQVIGWREFIRGVYQNLDELQESRNFWGHKNRLKPIWYQGDTGIPPLDRTLRRVIQRGYAHHIERLMVVGSLMVLLEVDPKEAYRWFMEMFIDSSDWVMGPNVYGMALFSDGGVFATKPYICGSNYLRKMSGEKPGEWCLGVDGLYWLFIRRNRNYFSKNPRLSIMVKSLEKIPKERWRLLESAARGLQSKLVEVV